MGAAEHGAAELLPGDFPNRHARRCAGAARFDDNRDSMSQKSSRSSLVTAVLVSACFAGTAFGQAASPVITKSFNPPVVALNGSSIGTITVTNPNPALPLTNVQFSDVMPAGIDLITQTGGTCSTLATGGGIFSINPGTDTFSSTSNVLAGGQSCTITVSVKGTVLGAHVNTTSPVTSNEAAPGGAASGTLTVVPDVPTLSGWTLMILAAALAVTAAIRMRIE
jgi:uncharacterized repeat protein (TIGR01451 family)